MPLVALCAGGMHSALLLLLALQKWQLGFWPLLYLVVHNLPPVHTHAVILAPYSSSLFSLLKETFVQVQALQPRVPLSHFLFLLSHLASNLSAGPEGSTLKPCPETCPHPTTTPVPSLDRTTVFSLPEFP